jgi:hypothetical protein
MIAEATHGLGFAPDTREAGVIEAIGFDQRERNVTIQPNVVGEVDPFARAFTEKAADLIAAGNEGTREVAPRFRAIGLRGAGLAFNLGPVACG